MSSTTQNNLSLEKLDNGEEIDGWDSHQRSNSDLIDLYASHSSQSVKNASGNQSDSTALNRTGLSIGSADALKKRLDNAMEQDGTPKPLPAFAYSKFDRRYGTVQGVYEASARLGQEVYWASQGQESTDLSSQPDALRKSLAELRSRNSLISGTLNVAVAASIPTLQPSGGSCWFDIDGSRYELRDTKGSNDGAITAKSSVFIRVEPGDDVDKELYSMSDAKFAKNGLPSDAWNQFTSQANPSLILTKPGDIVRVSSNTNYGSENIAGDFIVKSVNAGTVIIEGGLPIPASTSSVQNVTLKVINPWAVKVLHDESPVVSNEYLIAQPVLPASPGSRCYVAEVHWTGAIAFDSFSYREHASFDSGWTQPPVLAGSNPASVIVSHRVGPGHQPYMSFGQKLVGPIKVRLLTGRLDASNYIHDVQEVPVSALIGGATLPPSGTFGWFGVLNRKDINLVYGAKLPVGPGYGFQRKADVSGFPNDTSLDASYEQNNANCVYRLLVFRD